MESNRKQKKYPKVKIYGKVYEMCRKLLPEEFNTLLEDYHGSLWTYPMFPVRIAYKRPFGYPNPMDIYLVKIAGADVLSYEQGFEQEFKRWDL